MNKGNIQQCAIVALSEINNKLRVLRTTQTLSGMIYHLEYDDKTKESLFVGPLDATKIDIIGTMCHFEPAKIRSNLDRAKTENACIVLVSYYESAVGYTHLFILTCK